MYHALLNGYLLQMQNSGTVLKYSTCQASIENGSVIKQIVSEIAEANE